MNSRISGSEEALATLACARFTSASVRACSSAAWDGLHAAGRPGRARPDARIEVAELIPAVAQWAENEMAEIFAGSLRDPRVRVELTDVAELIGPRGAAYDAILLDVDNGPEGITRPANDGSTTRAASPPPAPRCGRAACLRSGRPAPTEDSRGGCAPPALRRKGRLARPRRPRRRAPRDLVATRPGGARKNAQPTR